MSLSQNTKHFYEALVKFVPSFWGKPRCAALLQAYLDRIQEIEDKTWEMMLVREIGNADTARLNVLGKLVGQPRFDFDDETYRAVIRGKIRTNRSRGLTDDIIEVIRLITQTTGFVRVEHFVPATVWVVLEEAGLDFAIDAVRFLLPKARSAGVKQQFFWADDEDAWIWDDSTWATTGGGGDVYWSAETL